MDVRQALAAVPLLRTAWRWLPAPLRVPVAVVAVALWLIRRRGDSSATAPADA